MSLPGKHFAHNLIERRNLLFQLVRRDFEQRFVGSAAGWLWNMIHPLVLLISWIFVFQLCMKSTLPKTEVTQNYALFLFCGFLPWLLFQDTVQRSASSILDHANLITKTVFPAEIIPVSIFLSSLINHLITLSLAVAVVAIYLRHVSVWILLLPIYMLLIGLFAVGVGWIVRVSMSISATPHKCWWSPTFWFWMTPIFIDEQQFPPQFRFLLRINPLASLVRAYRDRLLSNRLPRLSEMAIVAAYAITAFILGGLFFRHLKRGFADVL